MIQRSLFRGLGKSIPYVAKIVYANSKKDGSIDTSFGVNIHLLSYKKSNFRDRSLFKCQGGG